MSELAEYFEEVAAMNAAAALANSGDRRLAINAIMTLDGFFGTLHATLYAQQSISEKSDIQWKEARARDCHEYRVLRDAAYALKHGELTHPTPRVVRRADQILTMPATFDAATFDRGSFDTTTVWIEGNDTDYRADEIIKSVLELAREWLRKV
jgi:hypothetical protein